MIITSNNDNKKKMMMSSNTNTNMNQKNQTLLSSLMGTWTWSSKLHIGTYDIKSAFVMYITPDPMRQFSCVANNADDCNEYNGKFCHLSPQPSSDDSSSSSLWKPTCRNMNDTISHYSDALVYYHVSFQIDGNFPIREHGIIGTGGWVGPFNVIWAQNNKHNNHKSSSDASTVVNTTSSSRDRYTIRYVETATTPLLSRRLDDDNLFPKPTVDNNTFYIASFGIPAVKETLDRQTHLQPGGIDDETGHDPYSDYKKNCNHGNIRPLLPMISFDFVTTNTTDSNSNKNTTSTSTTTTIEWELDYQTMIAPATTQLPLARFLPMFARTINSMPSLGITLEGPYCYENDPNRVWMMKMSENSTSITKTTIRPTKGCVEGFPCRPEKLILSGGGGNSPTPPQPVVPDNCPQVNLNDLLLWKAATTILILLWTCTIIPLVCCCGYGNGGGGGNGNGSRSSGCNNKMMNCFRRRRQQQQESSTEEETAGTGGTDPALEEPLLQQHQQEQQQQACQNLHRCASDTPATHSPSSSSSSLLPATRESEETTQQQQQVSSNV